MNTNLGAPVDCRVALLTSPGRSAVATVAVAGQDALRLVAQQFSTPGRAAAGELPVGRIVVGHWRTSGGHVEETVVCRRDAARIEVNCHGGFAASEAIIHSLVASGATRIESSAWLAHFVDDAIQRAAWLALASARTPKVAGILLDQLRGALSRSLREVVTELANQLQNRDDKLQWLDQRLTRMLAWAGVGMHLTTPWRIVFAGAPNVGKSSLINAILGYTRSIVLDEPGTTRDVLTASAAIDGWPVELVDTAGLRKSADPIETEGVARAQAQIDRADLVVQVTDSVVLGDADDDDFGTSVRSVRVLNKCDQLPAGWRVPADWVCTTATTGDGVNRLLGCIIARLVPDSPPPGEAVPFTSEQMDVIQQMIDGLRDERLPDAIAAGRCLLEPTRPIQA